MSSISRRIWVIGCSAPRGWGSPGSVTSVVSRSSAAPSSSASSVGLRAPPGPPRRPPGPRWRPARPRPRSCGGSDADARQHARQRGCAGRCAPPARPPARRGSAAARDGRERVRARSPQIPGCSSAVQAIRRARPGPAASARWRPASASRAAPAAATFSDSEPAAWGIVTRTTARPSASSSSAPPSPVRSAPSASTIGRVRSASQGGTPPRGTAPTTSKPSRVPRSAGLTPSSSGTAKVAPIAARTARGWKASAEPGPERQPVGAERGGRAHQRAHVARVGDAGQVDAQRRAGSARRGSCATGGLREDADDARRRGQAARSREQLRGHAVALGQPLGGGDAGVVVGHAVGVHEQGDRPHAARQGGVDQVLALGHEQAPLAADLLGLERGDQPQRGVPRRADEPQPRAGRR